MASLHRAEIFLRGGGSRRSPPGGFNPPATEGVPTACRIHFQLSCRITAGPSRHSFEQFDLQCSKPLSFSFPQRPGDHRSPAQNFCFLYLVGPSWSIFSPFQPRFKNDIEQNIEKNAKIEDFGLPNPSQNPPKILSKSMSQKTCNFSPMFA